MPAHQQNRYFHRRVEFRRVPTLTLANLSYLDLSEIKGTVSSTTIPYDYLVFAVGAEVQTFGIPGVQEKACFMKELADAERVRMHS
jgi:NADH dehydrogenase FAD-containing subunit